MGLPPGQTRKPPGNIALTHGMGCVQHERFMRVLQPHEIYSLRAVSTGRGHISEMAMIYRDTTTVNKRGRDHERRLGTKTRHP